MRILVTGHEGYIGSVLVPVLLKAGHEVSGMDVGLFDRCGYGPPPPRIPAERKDIRDADEEDLKGVQAVIHLAALCNDACSAFEPSLTDAINTRATARLARLARAAGVSRFLFSSSCSVYGAGGDHLLDEEAPFRPVSQYAHSKIKAEQELRVLASDTFSPVCLRNPTLYGVSHRMRFDLVVNNLVAWGLAEERVFLKSDGRAWRPIAHVRDIARAMLAVLEAPRDAIHNEVFNMGASNQNYRITEVARLVAGLLADCPVVHAPEAGTDQRCYRVNARKFAGALPGVPAPVTMTDGIRELMEACRRFPVTVEEFEGAKLNRVDHLQKLREEGLLDGDFRWAEAVLS